MKEDFDGWVGKCRKLYKDKRYEEALEYADKILTKNSLHLKTLFIKADSHFHLNQYDQALKAARTLRHANDQHPGALKIIRAIKNKEEQKMHPTAYPMDEVSNTKLAKSVAKLDEGMVKIYKTVGIWPRELMSSEDETSSEEKPAKVSPSSPRIPEEPVLGLGLSVNEWEKSIKKNEAEARQKVELAEETRKKLEKNHKKIKDGMRKLYKTAGRGPAWELGGHEELSNKKLAEKEHAIKRTEHREDKKFPEEYASVESVNTTRVKLPPKDKELSVKEILEESNVFFKEGKYKEAFACVEQVQGGNLVECRDILETKARVLIQLKQYEKALYIVNDFLGADEENPFYNQRKGVILFFQGKYNEASTYFDRTLSYVMERGDIYSSALQGKAICLLQEGKKKPTCNALLKKAKKIVKGNNTAIAALNKEGGDLFFAIKAYDRAKSAYETVLAINPNDVHAKKCLEEISSLCSVNKNKATRKMSADTLLSERDLNDEEKEKKEMEVTVAAKELKTSLAEIAAVTSIDKHMLDAFQPELSGEGLSSIEQLSSNLSVIKNDDKRCEKFLVPTDKLLELESENIEAQSLKANILYLQSRYEDALVCWDKVLEHEPENRAALKEKANCLIKLNHTEEALGYLDKLLKDDFEDRMEERVVLQNRLSCLVTQKRYKEALECTDRILELEPEDRMEILEVKASLLIQLGRFSEALEYVNQILKCEPDSLHVMRYKVECLSGLERNGEALACVNEILAKEPENSTALQWSSYLKRDEEAFSDTNQLLKQESEQKDEELSDEFPLFLHDIAPNLKDENSEYEASFIDVLVFREYEARSNPDIHAEAAVVDRDGKNFDRVIKNASSTPKRYVFIPLCVAYDEDSASVKNHWVAVIVDKQAKVIFYLDPARKTDISPRIQLLKNRLEIQNEVVKNPIDFQQKEKEEGFIRHCGMYVVQIFRVFENYIHQGRVISLDGRAGLALQGALNGISCREEKDIYSIRQQHRDMVIRFIEGHKKQTETEIFPTSTEISNEKSEALSHSEGGFDEDTTHEFKQLVENEEVSSEKTFIYAQESESEKKPSVNNSEISTDFSAFTKNIKSVSQASYISAPVSSSPPENKPSIEMKSCSNLKCVREPVVSSTSEKDRAVLFIVYPIMGGTSQLKEFSDKLDPRVLKKMNLAVYVWRSPLLAMKNCDEPEYKKKWEELCQMEKQAEEAIAGIKSVQPHGPYYLCGWSFGGSLTLEIARQLRVKGDQVKHIALIDPQTPARLRNLNQAALKGRLLQHINYISGFILGEVLKEEKLLTFDKVECENVHLIHAAFKEVFAKLKFYHEQENYVKLKGILWALYANYLAIYDYYPEKLFEGKNRLPAVTVYVAEKLPQQLPEPEYYLNDFAGIAEAKIDESLVEDVNHFDIVLKDQMANLLTRHLKNIAKIKLSNKLWVCLERHYQTLEFGSLQFLYDDLPFDIGKCQFNTPSTSKDMKLKSLFDEVSPYRHVLILGSAGIGKTILSRQLTAQNLESKIWKQKKWPFYIPLRTLANFVDHLDYPLAQTHLFIENLLYHSIFKLFGISFEEVCTFWDFIQREPEKICFILDGLDEMPADRNLDEALKALFRLKCAVVVTTRDYHMARLRAHGFSPDVKFTVQPLEAKALTDVFVPDYFEVLGDVGKGTRLLEWMESLPVVKEFAQTPLHLTMLCSIWNRFEEEISVGEKSLLNIFRLTVNNMFRRFRFLVDGRLADAIELNGLSENEIEKLTADVSVFLQRCAFERIYTGCRELTSTNLSQLLQSDQKGSHFFTKVLASGFLQATHYAQYDIDRNFQFNSKAMEFYFGCQFVIRRLNDTAELKTDETEQLQAFVRNIGKEFDPRLIEALFVRELTAEGNQRFVLLVRQSAAQEESYSFNQISMMTYALEREITLHHEFAGDGSEAAEVVISEELGEFLYCFSSSFSEAYGQDGKKDRLDVESKELRTYKDRVKVLMNKCPGVLRRLKADPRFVQPYAGNEGVLHYAVKRKSERLLKLLLKCNPDIAMENDSGKTPVTLATEGGFQQGVDLLKAHMMNVAKKEETERKRTDIKKIKEKIQEEYISAWRAGKTEELERYVAQKLSELEKMFSNEKVAVKNMASAYELFVQMGNYVPDDVIRGVIRCMIENREDEHLREKIYNFFEDIIEKDPIPAEYYPLYHHILNITNANLKNFSKKENRRWALNILFNEYERNNDVNKIGLKSFLQAALKEAGADNVTKSHVLKYLLQKYKQDSLPKEWEVTLKLKEILNKWCEECYGKEMEEKIEVRMSRIEENDSSLDLPTDSALEASVLVETVQAAPSVARNFQFFPQQDRRVYPPNFAASKIPEKSAQGAKP